MTTFILVHGGSVTSAVWNLILPLLSKDGDIVHAPTLTDEKTSTLSEHINQVSSLVAPAGSEPVILIGHSYGGMVITGVAARFPTTITGMIYIDAAVPDPGESLFSLFTASGVDPASVEGLDPYLPYIEALIYNPMVIEPIPKLFIKCTQSRFILLSGLVTRRISSQLRKNWTIRELPSDHTPMLSMPDQLIPCIREWIR